MAKEKKWNSLKDKMCREFVYLLDVPKTYPTYRPPYRIFNAIFDTIVEALHRGESVNIDGLGVFSVRERSKTKHSVSHNYRINEKGGAYGGWTIESFPAKKYVHFTPHPTILEALNGD